MRSLSRLPTAREMRRQEKRAQRYKPLRERAGLAPPMLLKMQYVLAPLERILDDIERTGCVEVTSQGMPIFKHQAEAGGIAHALTPAIEGIADFFEMFCVRRGSSLELAGLRQLAKRLEYAMPVTDACLVSARADMDKMRALVPLLSQQEADSLILQTQIKGEMEKLS